MYDGCVTAYNTTAHPTRLQQPSWDTQYILTVVQIAPRYSATCTLRPLRLAQELHGPIRLINMTSKNH